MFLRIVLGLRYSRTPVPPYPRSLESPGGGRVPAGSPSGSLFTSFALRSDLILLQVFYKLTNLL